jgi:hypothetical protein
MAGLIENYSKIEVRALVRFLQVEGVSQSEIYRRLVSDYAPKVFKKVSVWCDKFKDGRTALNDDPQGHRGRPRASHADENSVIVEGLTREDQKVKFREIAK